MSVFLLYQSRLEPNHTPVQRPSTKPVSQQRATKKLCGINPPTTTRPHSPSGLSRAFPATGASFSSSSVTFFVKALPVHRSKCLLSNPDTHCDNRSQSFFPRRTELTVCLAEHAGRTAHRPRNRVYCVSISCLCSKWERKLTLYSVWKHISIIMPHVLGLYASYYSSY